MIKTILVHGSGHKATSWNETVTYMRNNKEIYCPNLGTMIKKGNAEYNELYSEFSKYCNEIDGQINLCGISLGGIVALNYTLDFPNKVKKLVLIGTPHKIPKMLFSIQHFIFRFLPKSVFDNMEFNKGDMLALANSMKNLDFSNLAQNIKCQTLIICGKKDSANIKSAYFLHDNIKNSNLNIIENTGHVVNEENPKELAEILDEYYIENN